MNEQTKKQRWIKSEHDKAVQIHWDNIDRIKKLDANNQANVAEIFRRRYSNEGFLEIVKDKLKQNNISMGPATIDYFKNILINDPAFANPYATN